MQQLIPLSLKLKKAVPIREPPFLFVPKKSTIPRLVELNPAGEPSAAAALHHNPGRLAFIDLGLALAAAPVLQVERVDVGQEEWHAGLG